MAIAADIAEEVKERNLGTLCEKSIFILALLKRQ